MSTSEYSRGSEWRQWDLHIHTPASFHWHGQRFDPDLSSESTKILVDQMINAMNTADPAVFALMDYWTFDGWYALKRRLKDKDAPKLTKTVFPGIELRLAAPTKVRLNAHVVFSDRIEDQTLSDFMHALEVEIVKRPLSTHALISLARTVGEDLLRKHGFLKADIDADDAKALMAGSAIAEINCDTYKTAIQKVPDGQAIGFMPYDTSDGLDEVNWHEHYAYFLGLFRQSPIFESRNTELRHAFVGEETPANKRFFKSFQAGLQNVPRLVVSGSDAHRFTGTKQDNNSRGYGDFPSGKITWIKADPTFQGLKQAIMEPAKRSYIGPRPPKIVEIAANKTFFIDSIEIKKTPAAAQAGKWLDGVKLPLNPDLVAIIGNKGSGKSALADVIALLGNSRQKAHFSFLKKDRFRGKSGDPAKYFGGTLTWCDGNRETRCLNDDPPDDRVELVRYIPQGHFEELCNAHVSGQSDAFENELRAVIFSHAGDDIRLGALDFSQLLEQQERAFRSHLNDCRKNLHALNEAISGCEDQLQPDVKKELQELLTLKERQLVEHQKARPIEVPKPSEQLTAEQQAAAGQLDVLNATLTVLDEERVKATSAGSALAAKVKAIQNIREHVRLLERAHSYFVDETAKDLKVLGLRPGEVVHLSVMTDRLDHMAEQVIEQQEELKKQGHSAAVRRDDLLKQQASLQAQLNAPQLEYQHSLKSIGEWTARLAELTGSTDAPDSLLGLKERIAQLDVLPVALEAHRARRDEVAGEIFDILDAQRKSRELLFKPVQDLIQSSTLIRDDYKLQFRAALGGSVEPLCGTLFSLIKQNSGEFRGEDESYGTVRRLAEQFDFNKRTDVLAFVNRLHEKIVAAAISSGKSAVGIASTLRKDKAASEVYDLLFGLNFLEPRYSLLFQGTLIEQLSPGQRGALLLIFYLLVGKERNPIILDQPEENLDNETVVSLLVPVLTQAKKSRQIIMVTHNPNLAVVCDAEQIIWATFDRKDDSRIAYTAGSIENPAINKRVVDVLEGTKPAFNNRRVKYH